MAKRYDPTEYLYASARIRALESGLTAKEQWYQLSELGTEEEILAAYAPRGVTEKGVAVAEAALRAAFATVAASVPDSTLIRFLQYPYDCNNVKALEKCRIRGLDPTELLIDLGSIPAKSLQTVSENELLELLPHHMAEALPAAREAFEKTGNPQEIDLILDCAAFADMREAAAPFPFATKLVSVKAELTNLLICSRLLRLPCTDLARAMLEKAAIPCERFDREALLSLYDGGEEGFYSALANTPYAAIFEKGVPLFEIEKRVDNHIAALVREARTVTFGAEIPIAYLMAWENECKNLRILLTGKRAGLDGTTVRARMREQYV